MGRLNLSELTLAQCVRRTAADQRQNAQRRGSTVIRLFLSLSNSLSDSHSGSFTYRNKKRTKNIEFNKFSFSFGWFASFRWSRTMRINFFSLRPIEAKRSGNCFPLIRFTVYCYRTKWADEDLRTISIYLLCFFVRCSEEMIIHWNLLLIRVDWMQLAGVVLSARAAMNELIEINFCLFRFVYFSL